MDGLSKKLFKKIEFQLLWSMHKNAMEVFSKELLIMNILDQNIIHILSIFKFIKHFEWLILLILMTYCLTMFVSFIVGSGGTYTF